MSTDERNRQTEDRQSSESMDQDQMQQVSNTNDAVEDDGTPVLDEIDLEENGLSEDEADNIQWEEPR